MVLTERRKADRHKMLDAVEATVKEHGATVLERIAEPDCFLGPRACLISFETERGLRLSVDFNGQSTQPDIHVLSWHVATGAQWDHVKLSPAFAPSVNTIHWHKATDIAEGFDELLRILAARLRSVKDGSAFQ